MMIRRQLAFVSTAAFLSHGCGSINIPPSATADTSQPTPEPDSGGVTPVAALGSPCEDNRDCVGAVCNLQCVKGACAALECDDGNACTPTSMCNGYACEGEVNCDDGDPCTIEDRCEEGGCIRTRLVCQPEVVCDGDSIVTYAQSCGGTASCERAPGPEQERQTCPNGCALGACLPAPGALTLEGLGLSSGAQVMNGSGFTVECEMTPLPTSRLTSSSYTMTLGVWAD